MLRALIVAGLLLAGCGPSEAPERGLAAAMAEVNAREIVFPNYPQRNRTYLTFSQAHGFQVFHTGASERSWLWYPGNRAGVPGAYELRVVRGQEAVCFRYPRTSFNPVTQRQGGAWTCANLEFQRKTVVAALPGDPFSLASGAVPYRRDRCDAPQAFSFDRARFRC